MKLIQLLPWRRTPATLPSSTAAGVAEEVSCPEDDARPFGCGWFDSSHELQRGLFVRELSTPESQARELPLAGWLEWQLAADAGRARDAAPATLARRN